MAVNTDGRRLPVVPSQDGAPRPKVDESHLPYEHPLYKSMLAVPGLSVATAALDQILEWGLTNSLWVFPMATSCCGIELMSAAASRVDLDRMGTIVRATPRQADVMVIAGTITVKMAPRVKALWDQMPEPKWAIAMGSCAISGDFYRNLYAVVPGIDTVIPVDVYIPGCPPNPEALMHGLLRLKEKVQLMRAGKLPPRDMNPTLLANTQPSVLRFSDPLRTEELNEQQVTSALECSSFDRSDEDAPEGEAEEPAPFVADENPKELSELLTELGVTDLAPKDGAPVVAVDKHWELAHRLRAAGYRSLVYVVATHWAEKTGAKPSPERFEVAFGLRSVGKGSKVAAWRLQLSPGQGVPSLVGLFAGADWQEREQFDLVGVRFEGHPDLRRIMMPENYPGHPLRKDFAADTACPPWR